MARVREGLANHDQVPVSAASAISFRRPSWGWMAAAAAFVLVLVGVLYWKPAPKVDSITQVRPPDVDPAPTPEPDPTATAQQTPELESPAPEQVPPPQAPTPIVVQPGPKLVPPATPVKQPEPVVKQPEPPPLKEPKPVVKGTGAGAEVVSAPPKPKTLDDAVRGGMAYLRAKASVFAKESKNDELVLWTWYQGGVPESDPEFAAALKASLEKKLEKTYNVALLAMLLEDLDRVKYQKRIAQCAQFLVDNQCQNGQWNYGSPTEFAAKVSVPAAPKAVASADPKTPGAAPALAKDGKPKVLQHVAVKKMKEGPPDGDNSNSQYAALGLRACFDAGVTLPEGVIVLAVKWWRESQFKDPKKDKEGKPIVASGVTGKVEGWNYKAEGTDERAPYHAMSAGGVGSLVLYDYMLDRKWKDDSFVKAGMNWLQGHYQIQAWNTYYLYGLERAAILFGTEKIGDHFWYAEGATALIGAQAADGSWGKDTDWFNTTWDTCFSVLFLRRATRALVITGDSKLKK
jgi:hypothetical protein